MQGWGVHVVRAFNLDEAHRESGNGVGDRAGTDNVILVELQITLHELSRQDTHRVAQRLNLLREPLKTGARFHSYNRRLCAFEKLEQRLALGGS